MPEIPSDHSHSPDELNDRGLPVDLSHHEEQMSQARRLAETSTVISNYEVLDTDIDGAEIKQFFDTDKTGEVLAGIGSWFELNKDKFPKVGIGIYEDRDAPAPTGFNDIEFSPELIELLSQIIGDMNEDQENTGKPKRKIIMERTGDGFTHPDDYVYHVDTEKVLFDENGNRIGYSDNSGPDKYMVFVGRPGSLVVPGRIGNMPNSQANALANHYQLNQLTGETTVNGVADPKIVQLDSNKIWKTAVGDMIHAPIPHKDGLLITVSALTEQDVQERQFT